MRSIKYLKDQALEVRSKVTWDAVDVECTKESESESDRPQKPWR